MDNKDMGIEAIMGSSAENAEIEILVERGGIYAKHLKSCDFSEPRTGCKKACDCWKRFGERFMERLTLRHLKWTF